MSKAQRTAVQRYSISIMSVLVSLLFGLLLERLLRVDIAPLFFAAVVFSSWYGGRGSGLVATVASILANSYFFTPRLYSLELNSVTDGLQLIVFSTVAFLISSLTAQLQATKQRSEANLSNLQVSYRRLLETANEGVWIIDPEGRTEYANQRLAAMLGYRLDRILNRPIFNFLENDTRIEIKQWLEQQQQGGQATKQQFDLRLRHRDRSHLWAIASITPLLDRQKQFAGALMMLTDITERKQQEEALRISEQRYSTLAKASRVGIFYTDATGNCLYTNDCWCEITGMSSTEALGEGWSTSLHPDDRERIFTEWYTAAQTNQPFASEYRFLRSDGSVRWVLGQAAPQLQNDDSIIGYVGTITDLTNLKQAEAERQKLSLLLQQKQDWLDLAQVAAKIGSFEWNIQTNVNTWSKELEALYGLDPGEFGGTYEEWARWVHPDDLAKAEADIAQSLETGEFFTDWRVVWRDGSIHWIHARAKVFYDDEGKPLRMVGINGDITERKQADMALQESESRFRRIADSNMIGIFFFNLNGDITEANDAFLHMVGYTQQDLLDGKLRWSHMTPPEHIDRTQQAVEEVLKDRVCSPFEKEFFRKDGSRVFVLIAAAMFENSFEQGVCYIIDINARKQAEAERDRLFQLEQQARAEAEAANQIKDDFLAIVSHELRSPLNPILGWTKLLLTGRLDAAKTHQALEIIERNAKLQAQLIEDLLDVSRILRGKLSLNPSLVDLVAIIEAALETVRLAAEAKAIQIELHLSPKVGDVEGDPSRLQQVMWNLLTNAVKFTPAGGQVVIRLEKNGSQAQIEVSDSGKGISPDFLPYVFERFQQADATTTRKSGGLGLGLAIVHHIVKLHEGSVNVTSPGEGLGATFTVLLPLRKKDPRPLEDDLETGALEHFPDAQDLPDLRGLRIVIVDDDIDTLDLQTFILEQSGAEVRAIASAEKALEVIETMQPDVLLSDIAMPDMDGFSLIRNVRALEAAQGRTIAAIAVTAYAGEMDHQKIISAGFQKHITKPIAPDKLVAVIADISRR